MRNSIGIAVVVFIALSGTAIPAASATDAPAWMHAAASAPLPPHDEKTDAILLYSEDVTIVQSDGKTKGFERRAYKILRPDGRGYGTVRAYPSSATKIGGMRGWCIPAQGKDYEVKDKDAAETAAFDIENGILASDLKEKILKIPASEPGNIVGYEIEYQERPYVLQGHWTFQGMYPTREARYTLQLPPGWEYKAVWINHPDVAPSPVGSNQWQWVVKDVPEIRWEEEMPPLRGLVGQMVVAFLPPGRAQNGGFVTWGDVGKWETGLASGRRDGSPEIKQKVVALTANLTTELGKMQSLAQFLQSDIRYVGIELGIGGWQPHAATEVFTHRYGDCKDKATLLSAMLKESGIDSYYVIVNTRRGVVGSAMPASPFWFNHVILAVRLPENLNDLSLEAVLTHPKLGRLLIFDPTDEYTPFGHIRGALQGNYALLVTPDGGDLVRLPDLAPAMNGITRTAKMTLDPAGNLKGDVQEIRRGDSAKYQRYELRSVTKDADRIKPIETLLAHSLADFHITAATVTNLKQNTLPFQCNYSIVARNYAKNVGNLMLVRPRLIGSRVRDLLETKEPRKYPVEFSGPERDTDTFEIALPPGYEVDDLPPAMNADYSFASYHSKTEVNGNTLKYTRTFEVKELSVPLSKVEDLKKLYRIIAGDERNTAVLKPADH
jgi:Domain of Unknown Function with PDB structure (DUF3857)/Transglutaminase-like superfamily